MSLLNEWIPRPDRCPAHRDFDQRVEWNRKCREANIQKKYVIESTSKEGDVNYRSIPGNVKGGWLYATKFAKRLDLAEAMVSPGASRPGQLHNFMMTLTWPTRDDCYLCAYKGITARWRNFRQNWLNYGYPQMEAYIGVVEPHKDFYPHLHIITHQKHMFTSKQMSDLHKNWGARVDVQKARNPKGYIFKYLTKGLKDLTFISMLSELKVRQYFSSVGYLPIIPKNPDMDYFYLGEECEDLNKFSELFLWSKLDGLKPPSDMIRISSIQGLALYGKY